MKKKLIAAVTSLVMVATMVPATVSATTKPATAKTTVAAAAAEDSAELKAFKTAMEALPSDVKLITTANVDDMKTKYTAAETAYGNLSAEEMKQMTAEYNRLTTEIKPAIIEALADKVDEEILKVAKAKGVTKDTEFTNIESAITALTTFGGATAKQKITEAAKYEDAKLAKALANVINTNKASLEDATVATVKSAIETVEKDKAFTDATARAKTYADNYNVYEAAKAKVKEDEDNKKLVADYVQKLGDATELLKKSPTEQNVASAEALIKEADKALANITSKSDYDTAKSNLETEITTAKTAIKNQKAADDFAAKVKAVGTVSLANMASVQEIYTLLEGSIKTNTKVDVDTKLTAQNQIAALKKLIPTKKDDAFTEAVVKAFPVPAAGAVTTADADKIGMADTVLNTKNLVGESISAILNTDLDSYKAAVANINAAKGMLTDKQSAAKNKANDFVKYVLDTLSSKDATDADYEVALNKAQAQYEALPAEYKEGGSLYESPNDLGTSQDKSVKDAKEALDGYFKDLEDSTAGEKEDAVIKELIAAIAKLPADVEKLTITDKDTVYALRDKRDTLSATGLQKFNDAGDYEVTLEAAIGQIDKLVVADLIKQIDALKEVKEDASLADIQAAKEANKAARTAYDALNASQKKAVTNYVVLQGAEAAVIKAEIKYVQTQMEEIAKLDAAKLTVAQAKTIVNLQEIIDDMTNEQVATIKADKNYKAYQTALAAAQAIVKKATDLEQATVTAIADQTYTGEAVEPAVEVKNAFDEVVPADAYKVTYQNNTKVGTASVLIAPTTEGGYTGSITAEFKIKAASIAKATVTGVVSKTYTGKALTQKVVVKANGKTLKNGTDYTVSYKNNKNVGKATVTVKAKGNYTGTITKTFIVKPAKESITSLKKGTKRFTVKYKKQSGAKYQIYYKTAGSKAKTVKTSAVTKTVKNLKKGKTYTVKVRAYKAIDGKTYYGAYSKAKKVKVR